MFKIPFFHSLELYFDLGTSSTRIAVKDKGIVLKEPTYIGFNTKIKEPIFFGEEAKNILGKTPEFIKIERPIVNGIISDFDAEAQLIKQAITKSVAPYLNQYPLLKPQLKALVHYPLSATEIEQKAVEEVLLKVGCASVQMIVKPLATASGCGIDIFSHKPHLIVDLGGGIIEIAIVSSGGIVSGKSLKIAGEAMDKTIANYVYLKHGVILGEATCEKLKNTLLSFVQEDKLLTVRGKSLENGLPKSIKMKTDEIKEAVLSNFNQIIEGIKELIEISPPEIVDEIYSNGVFLTGGLASAKGVDAFFNEELKMNVSITENYADATIYGLLKLGAKASQTLIR